MNLIKLTSKILFPLCIKILNFLHEILQNFNSLKFYPPFAPQIKILPYINPQTTSKTRTFVRSSQWSLHKFHVSSFIFIFMLESIFTSVAVGYENSSRAFQVFPPQSFEVEINPSIDSTFDSRKKGKVFSYFHSLNNL